MRSRSPSASNKPSQPRPSPPPDELDLLALALWEANGERPTVYESGKAVADDVLEWWKQVAASAWGFINGTEAMQ